uniref:Uncharacterized protein n=1 Tax=viral metagenome TaxID=1070528 RepID=A0A6C0LVF3_9ZZZZ
MSTVDTSLVTFKAISNFCISLEEVFGKQQRSLKLYVRLITKTTLSHEKAIKKHISAFSNFCLANRDALEVKEASKLIMDKISYSERVFIDIKNIFSVADKETSSVIWKHLLIISALVDPTGKARQILKDSSKKGCESATEANFLHDIIGKVEKHVDPDANPMDAVASIMKSGVFAELVGGMGDGLQDGSLDLGKLMGTVQSMVTSLGGEGEGEGGGEGMDLMSSMMGSLSTGSSEGGAPPDLSGLMSMMGGIGGQEGGGAPDLSGLMNMMGPMIGALSQQQGIGGESSKE